MIDRFREMERPKVAQKDNSESGPAKKEDENEASEAEEEKVIE